MPHHKVPKELELNGEEEAFLEDMLAASGDVGGDQAESPARGATQQEQSRQVKDSTALMLLRQRLEPVPEASNENQASSGSSPRLRMTAAYGGVLPPMPTALEAAGPGTSRGQPPKPALEVPGSAGFAASQFDRQLRLASPPRSPSASQRPASPARSQQSMAAPVTPPLTHAEVAALLAPVQRLEQALSEALGSAEQGQEGEGERERERDEAHAAALAQRLCRSYNAASMQLMGGGALCVALEQLEKARVLLERMEVLRGVTGHSELRAVTLNNLGCYYQHVDMPDRALEHLQVCAQGGRWRMQLSGRPCQAAMSML